MKALADREVWFVTGSQHLYGADALRLVEDHARRSPAALDAAAAIPVRVIAKPVVTTPESIHEVCLSRDGRSSCVGRHRLDAHLLAGQDVDRRARRSYRSPFSISTPSSTAISPGQRSTWTS